MKDITDLKAAPSWATVFVLMAQASHVHWNGDVREWFHGVLPTLSTVPLAAVETVLARFADATLEANIAIIKRHKRLRWLAFVHNGDIAAILPHL